MGKFLSIAVFVVAALVLAPVAFLARTERSDFGDRVVLHSAYGSKVKSVDPATCGDTTSASMQGQVYEGLYAYHYLKRPVELVPQLAVDMPEISEDGTVYTIRIKPGIRYAPNPCFGLDADGKPKTRTIRAEDFVLQFKRIADFHIQVPLAWPFISGRIAGLDAFRKKCEDHKEGDFSRYDAKVEGVQALDELTLEIRLTKPFPQLNDVLAINNYCPMPREAIDYHLATEPAPGGGRRAIPVEQRTAQITQAEQIVSTGPYVMTTWKRGSKIVFERNPVYDHGRYPTEGSPGDEEAGLLDPEAAGKPLPFIDAIIYDCVLESLPAWLRFLSRQTDTSGIPRDVFETVITPDKELADKWARQGIRLVKFSVPVVFWLAFNMEDPVVGASKSLRQGMCLAYNVEDHIDVLLNGRGQRAVNILPQSFPAHEPSGPGPYYRHDPDAARAKLAAARKELRQAGKLDPEGRIPELTVDLGGRDESSRRLGEFIRQQFEPLGLRIKIELNDWPTLQQKVHNKRSQFYTMGWHADYPDGENFLQLFYGPNIEKGTNNTNYRNGEFDALFERVMVEPDAEKRRATYVTMVRMLSEDCPVLLMSEPIYYVLAYDWVKPYKRHPFGYGMTKYLRIDTELRREMGGP